MANPDPNRRVGLEIRAVTGPGILHQLTGVIARYEGDIDSVELINGEPTDTLYFEIDMLGDPSALVKDLLALPVVRHAALVDTMEQIYGKRIIIMGGGAQVGQVALGAILEADRHNIRGEHISIDTIPLVGEKPLASAVRAAARLPRVKAIVMAGSLMGGEIEQAVREVRAARAAGGQPQYGGQRPRRGGPGGDRSRAGGRHGGDGRGRYREVHRGQIVAPDILSAGVDRIAHVRFTTRYACEFMGMFGEYSSFV